MLMLGIICQFRPFRTSATSLAIPAPCCSICSQSWSSTGKHRGHLKLDDAHDLFLMINPYPWAHGKPRRDKSCRRSVLSEIFLPTAHVCVSLYTSDLDNIVSENGTAAAAATTLPIFPVKMEQAFEIEGWRNNIKNVFLLKRLLQSSRKVVKRSWPTKIEKFFIVNSWRLQKKIKSCKNHNLLTLDLAAPCN